MVNAAGPTSVESYSVKRLVDVHAGLRERRWRLSSVQRNAVWSGLQIGYLLDSLLWGYPIGSMLLCRVQRGGGVRVKDGDAYRREPAKKDELQLLDGQQRINALGALFTRAAEDPSGPFLLSLTRERDRHDLTRRRKSVKRSLRYIRIPEDESPIEERSEWLDVSGLHEASRYEGFPSGSDVANCEAKPDDYWLGLAVRIDPACVFKIDDRTQRREAAKLIRRLLISWYAESVPVVTLSLEDPTDVLQVFHRVNRAGTAVSGDDIFFAAVRTVWNDAERSIEKISKCASPSPNGNSPRLLPPIDALRVLARTAALTNDKGDVVPLDVERLRRGKRKGEEIPNELVVAMEQLSEDAGFQSRLRRFVKLTVQRSKLGYGLHEIPKRLLDPVLAWAGIHTKEVLDHSDMTPAWAFLVGATAFRYLSIFGPAFERLAMTAAIEAGENGEAFPTGRILDECRKNWPELRRRGSVLRVDEDRFLGGRELVNRNAALFLHIAQRVPFHLPEGRTIEIEHLFPRAKMANSMRWYGPKADAKVPSRHEHAGNALRAGNLCILDGLLNREASDEWPDIKLTRIYPLEKRWPKKLFLNRKEERLLLAACRELQRQMAHVPRNERKALLAECVGSGMEYFVHYVAEREERIYEAVRSQFPDSIRFGEVRNSNTC